MTASFAPARHRVMTTAPAELDRPEAAEEALVERPWITIVWNDPINLMSYVTYVFMTYFSYPREKAEQLMMQVHQEGRAVVSSGSREEMERDVTAMHSFGLWATMAKDD
jgi:ATP-dependent Clp protease adaptor protein ClpS